MIANYHTHSTFCDGKNTPEEIVIAAMEKNMSAIGFSGHGYTDYDLRYCMQDTQGYVNEINRLKKKYGKYIQIYLGIEEDAFCYTDRNHFDYIIGSCHYFCVNDSYYPIDSNYDYFKKCLDVFNYDVVAMAHSYYGAFCNYIKLRKPDIIGHYDLITKFDELNASLFLENKTYNSIAEEYTRQVCRSGCFFEVNTGAISRGFRTTPYPAQNLLRILKNESSGLILSSDSHNADTLDFGFDEARRYLKDIGFEYVYLLYNNEFIKDRL
jgi:histidinol-phosphatase (PHP family)